MVYWLMLYAVPEEVMYPFGLVDEYAPKFANAPAAVVDPVPPLPIATVPVTFAAVPLMFEDDVM